MASSDLAIFEAELKPLTSRFEDVLADRMPAERLMRTLVMACEKTPRLLQCTRQSLLNAGMTFGVLALEVDGVTGQGYLLPFKGTAQPVVGYKGYNTIGARSKLTITGNVVREGDVFDFAYGTKAFVHHKPGLDGDGRIIGAWAQAEAFDRPPIIEVLGLRQLEAVRAKSPGAKMSDSPWNDTAIGLPAMYGKTVKRRLARSTPMEWARPEFQLAARMEEAFDEQGRTSYIAPDQRVMIDGTASPIAPRDQGEPPTMADITGPKLDPELEKAKADLLEAAEGGTASLAAAWRFLAASSPRMARALEQFKDDEAKPLAARADT